MNDFYLIIVCLFTFGTGIRFCIYLHSTGVKTTHVRDFLHIITVLWLFSWKYWHNKLCPIFFVLTIFMIIMITPKLLRQNSYLRKLSKSVSNKDEKWSGVTLYVFSYLLFTFIGFFHSLIPAACALAVLSIGDGVGGLIGSKFGKLKYKIPWSKPKSYLGSTAVFVGSYLAIQMVTWWFNEPLSIASVVIVSAIAAIVEAASPRTSDNLLMPVAVYLALELL